jgi:hypothetical protein
VSSIIISECVPFVLQVIASVKEACGELEEAAVVRARHIRLLRSCWFRFVMVHCLVWCLCCYLVPFLCMHASLCFSLAHHCDTVLLCVFYISCMCGSRCCAVFLVGSVLSCGVLVLCAIVCPLPWFRISIAVLPSWFRSVLRHGPTLRVRGFIRVVVFAFSECVFSYGDVMVVFLALALKVWI